MKGLRKTTKLLLFYWCLVRDSKQSRALLTHRTSECMCWEICREMYTDNIKMNLEEYSCYVNFIGPSG
jgi:hypothetical protein